MAVSREMIATPGSAVIIKHAGAAQRHKIHLADSSLAIQHVVVLVNVLVHILQALDICVGCSYGRQDTRAASTTPAPVDNLIILLLLVFISRAR